MKHFLCRDDLLELASGHPRKSIQRAVLDDNVECLGFFLRFSDEDLRPGWGFRVNGLGKGKQWVYMAVYKDRGFVYKSMDRPGTVPWRYWYGDGSLKDGDRPSWYKLKRAEAEKLHDKKTTARLPKKSR